MLPQTEATLQEIFRAVLDLPPGVDVSEVSQPTQPKWDSLAHVSLVAAIESEFGVEIDISDALDLTSYQAVAKYLRARGK